ncbi:hypothetical protein LIA77_05760 [Sarocladium implicatum]|nr:hypothetical protein LIA77_05760 [Sarocladium implicatum]
MIVPKTAAYRYWRPVKRCIIWAETHSHSHSACPRSRTLVNERLGPYGDPLADAFGEIAPRLSSPFSVSDSNPEIAYELPSFDQPLDQVRSMGHVSRVGG